MMPPHESLYKTYSIIIPHPFTEKQLGGRYAAQLLKLPSDDCVSLEKVRASAISMVLCLLCRGTTEAFVSQYGNEFESSSGLNKVMIKGVKLFDSIVESERNKADMPSYVDSNYFFRWRGRYEEGMLNDSRSIKGAVLSSFLKQATFQYGDEPAVSANESLIMFYADDVYDNYVISLRDLLGVNVL